MKQNKSSDDGGSMEKAREQSKCSEEWEETFYHAYIPVARSIAGRILYPSGTNEDIEELALDAVYLSLIHI